MFKSFKFRLLVVVVITTLVSLGMQLNNNTQAILTPVLSFMLKDYEIEKKVLVMWENSKLKSGIPVSPVTTETFASPCESFQIEQNYGWYLNRTSQKQEFSPGVNLSVPDNSLIKAVMGGKVIELGGDNNSRSVLVQHADNLFSHYEGLKEVLVEKDALVKQGEVLGKSQEKVYFELRSEDGPLNPVSIFN